MSIDWTKAPEGATHYHIGDDINPWRKIKDTVAYEHYRGKWLKVNSFNEGCMPDYYVPIPQETWDGQGLPPVGAKCLTDRNDFRREVTILCHGKTRTFVFDHVIQNEICLLLKDRVFLPIRTPEQIAAEEREKAIEEMCFAEETLTVKQAKALFDAGYRRQEEGK
ncbi:hypothetical protein ACEOQ5_28140 [Pseudomonas aeruginosa]